MIVANPYVTLGDGTQLDAQAGYYDHQLHIWITGQDLVQAFQTFTNQGKVAEISFFHGTVKDVYRGFNELISIRTTDTTDVVLIGANTEIETLPIEEEETEPVEEEGGNDDQLTGTD